MTYGHCVVVLYNYSHDFAARLNGFWHFARHPAVYIAFASDWIRRSTVDERGLLQEAHRQMKLFRNSLGRNVALSRPHDVFDVQTVLVGLIALPNSDLVWERYLCIIHHGRSFI